MGQPAARMTDMHTCPLATPGTPPVPHVGGPIIKGEPTVLVCMLPAARMTDTAVCVGPTDIIAKGSGTVLAGKLPMARMGDSTAHGGVIVAGAPTVLVGG
ncbi:MAG: type VI secretion protein [Deltaproteobacteria bacterium]|nr:MAG: type VI secretion protein [Deltaproteobacteria bacterium]